MTPAAREMPRTTATWSATRRRWIVALPGKLELPARDEYEVEELVAKFASGSSIAFIRTDAQPAAASGSEQRAGDGLTSGPGPAWRSARAQSSEERDKGRSRDR